MKTFTTILFLGLFAEIASAQQFSLSAYQEFLQAHQDMTTSQLLSLYPAGLFRREATTNYAAAAYSDSIDIKYSLTSYEKSLIEQNGFMVTQRFNDSTFGQSFGNAYADVYHKDLPVFISTDAILHAIHKSYDEILVRTETGTLIPSVRTLLERLRGALPGLASRYAAFPEMEQNFKDVDLYLTVPMTLLDSTVTALYPADQGTVNTLLGLIAAEQPANYPLFSSTPKTIDFSQFTPRGHYTQSPALTEYFKAMMWLGRIGLDLTKTVSAGVPPADSDIQRQTIDAVLVGELADTAGALPLYNQIDEILRFFVGSQDNVTLPDIDSLSQSIDLTNASALLDTLKWRQFQDTLLTKPYASQKILSQILMADPFSPGEVQPPSAFMLFGQRFVIDSYIMGNVVYDRIAAKRMLPSPLDVLFAEGNSAAGQLLQSQLNEYSYSPNLAALRYLIDSYAPSFWQMTLYNSWSNAIRSLNPPAQRDSLPAFMQTAAWWQEKMNTQLASWAELRHDNLLYAKQSYSAGVMCSYPESYVEPVPQFYDAVEALAETGEKIFNQPLFLQTGIAAYFTNLKFTADTLGDIARKELSNTPLGASEKTFLTDMLTTNHYVDCGAPDYNGWYLKLFYGYFLGSNNEAPFESDMVVADVHTAPTDSIGDPVGWVLEAGTGPVNLAVVVANLPGVGNTAFVGPVMSFYTDLTQNYIRLTDQQWQTMYNVAPSLRPSWVNIYLANTSGTERSGGESLLTGIQPNPAKDNLPETYVLDQNYPNPFNPSTIIAFTIPQSMSNKHVTIYIYNTLGQIVKKLLSKNLSAGNYTVRWDGTNQGGAPVASGVYFYRLTAPGANVAKKMLLVR